MGWVAVLKRFLKEITEMVRFEQRLESSEERVTQVS